MRWCLHINSCSSAFCRQSQVLLWIVTYKWLWIMFEIFPVCIGNNCFKFENWDSQFERVFRPAENRMLRESITEEFDHRSNFEIQRLSGWTCVISVRARFSNLGTLSQLVIQFWMQHTPRMKRVFAAQREHQNSWCILKRQTARDHKLIKIVYIGHLGQDGEL